MKFSFPMPGGGTGVTLFSKLVRTKDLRSVQGEDPRSTKPKLTSLCADDNCDKSSSHHIQDGRSVVVSSPSKSTAENGAKGKGTMREAFPSLSFGSPALNRDSRDKDRTVERDTIQQLTTTNPTNISTSPATSTHREEFPRIIERDSSSSVINTDANTKQTSASATAVTSVPLSRPGELEELQSILHFPEEVALRLTDAEYQLFYQVPPVDYFKHVILELQNDSGTLPVQTKSTIRALQKRFDEVCSWVTHFIISQPTHDERKAAFSCLLRAALTCWNIGNFNGAMEITTGLRSIQLKSLLTTFTEKGKIPVLEFLSAALESAEYERALGRGLAMPEYWQKMIKY